MRYKFVILFLLIGFISKAQVYQLMPQYGYNTYRMNFDSTIQIPTFCGVPKLGSNITKKGALAFDSCNNRFYFFNPKFQSWDTIKSADASLFVKYTDTASLLQPYLRKGDTIFLSQRIDQRVKYSDTSGMLLPYLKAIDTTNKWVSSVTKLNDSTIRVIKDGTTTDISISSVTSATRLITQVWNNTGATILRGSVVYISGRHSSNLPTIALAEANNEANSYKTFALVDGDIGDNSSGFVIQAGKIGGLNLPTSSYTDGDILYLSPTVPGGYTTTKPLAPNHIVKLGSVTRAHPTQGSIEIKIENGWQLDELSDVQIAAVPLDSTILQFSRIDSLWHDVSPLTAMGNRFVKSTDSAAMLQPYLRSNVAAATYATITQNNLKLNISDTSAMLNPYLRKIDTTNKYVTSVFRKTASDSVFFVRGGTNNFAFRDSAGGGNIYTTDGSLTSARTLTLNSQPLTIAGTTSSRFFANGNVGIGTTTDAGRRLEVNGTANVQTSLTVGNGILDLGFSSPNAFINANGNGWNLEMRRGGNTFYKLWGSTGRHIFTDYSGIGTAEISSALLSLNSNTNGFLQPRMTTSQMNAISTPATGLSVFNTTDSVPYTYRGTTGGWQKNVIYNRNNDVALFNGANQRIMIDTTSNVVAGRTLTVEAGSTIAGASSTFNPLSQTTREWRGIAAAPNGDIYASVIDGFIYKQTGGTGNFNAVHSTSRLWLWIGVAPNGDIYAPVVGGDIYKSTDGGTTFNALSQTNRNWYAIAAAPNGDVYATVNNGFIYKQTGGTGNFVAVHSTSRLWTGIAVAPNSDIYAAVDGGDIYKSTDGGTTFNALSQTNRSWTGLSASSNGDIYANVDNGDIYKQTGGTGDFVGLSQTARRWSGITIAPNGNIYSVVRGVDIFLQSQGTANLNGGTLILQSGSGKGTGTSTINFNTTTPTVSGNVLQTASTKMTILGNGNVGIGTTSPSAKLELSDTARGFLQTRMTTTQRNNIASPSIGLQVFTTTDSSQYVYRGTTSGWQQLANEIFATATLNFPNTLTQTSSDLTITLTGAVDGDAVVLGVPNAAMNANSCYTAWVSAANTVTVRFNNYSSGAIDPAQATFKVTIIK